MEAYDLAEIFQKGLSYHQAHQFNEAKHCYLQILEHRPNHPDSLHLLGLIALEEGDLNTAKQWLEKAIDINPNQAEFYNSLAQLYLKLEDYSEALSLLDSALEINPALVPALLTVAEVSENLGHPDQAIEYYQRLLHFQPNHFPACNAYARLLAKFREYAKARAIFEKLIKTHPEDPIAYNNLGTMLMEQGNHDEALSFFHKALALQPNFPQALLNSCISWMAKKEYSKAIDFLQQMLPNEAKQNEFHWMHAKMLSVLAMCYCHTCQWQELDELRSQLPRLIKKFREPIIEPMQALALELNEDIYKHICQQLCEQRQTLKYNHQSPAAFDAEQKIKIGYLSPDFSEHPVGLLFHQFVEYHSDSFEIYALSLKRHDSPIYEDIKNKVDHFVDLSTYSLYEKIKTVSAYKLDLLIDLAGYTEGSEPELLSARLARKQATWLGYPSSLHHPEVDYFLAPEVILQRVHHYSFHEKLVGLKSWVGCNKFNDETAGVVSREDYGLPEDAFVFCCFHRHYRINKATFDCWMQVLAKAPKAVLWLNSGDERTNEHLREVAARYNIAPERLIFSPPERLTLQWRHQLADVWLDTFSFSAGTSSILSSWVSLPFITLASDTPQSLSGTAIANMLEMPELITESQQEYINKAIQWANSPEDFAKIKTQMSTAKQSRLFDPQQFITEFEEKLIEISHDQQGGT